jgi:geranylgeranyl pyrophosphate synthase
MAFQIVDDILDITGTESSLGKPRMVDFFEGKATLPLIHAMGDPAAGPRLSQLFHNKVKTEEDIEEAQALIVRTDAIERSKRKAKEYAEKALRALEPLPDSEHKLGLQRLAAKVVDRNY